jgi:RimJ/RimL family protein N-acetyltransferase
MEISTKRLRLIPLTADQLRRYIPAPEELEQELGFKVSRDIVTDRLRRAIAMKLAKMEQAAPFEHDWYTYWLIVVKNGAYGAGLIGFKGVPDVEGKTEIGYGIDPAYRNKGYTTEAVIGLIEWAFEYPGCRRVIAPDTKKVNVASNRVLEKAGMQVYNETEDAFDWKIDKV